MSLCRSLIFLALVLGQCLHVFAQVPEGPGCTDPEACNYDDWATEDDGSCEYETHPLIPSSYLFYGMAIDWWCGPLPDCSNVLIGCDIPSTYTAGDPDCVESVIEIAESCASEWTSTCQALKESKVTSIIPLLA